MFGARTSALFSQSRVFISAQKVVKKQNLFIERVGKKLLLSSSPVHVHCVFQQIHCSAFLFLSLMSIRQNDDLDYLFVYLNSRSELS